MAQKNRLAVPSEKEMKRLPRWARVAFAARCARRVQPLFKACWPEAPAEHCEAVEQGIRIAELAAAAAEAVSAASATAAFASADAANPAFAAATAACYAARADTYENRVSATSRISPAVAREAAHAAAEADEATTNETMRAVASAAGAVRGTAAKNSTIRAMRTDLERLRAAARKQGWTDETPVPPGFFGPLWPEGEPLGWPTIPEAAKEPEVSSAEVGRLPRWAQVAFAARCARRIQPLFQAKWPEAPPGHVEGVERAIRAAETWAAAADARVSLPVRRAADVAARAVARHDAPAVAAPTSSDAAAKASSAAAVAVSAADAVSAASEAAFAASAVKHAARAVRGTAAESRVIRAMRRDFEKLKAAAQKEGWTDKTPVPPEFFGPLWPEGEPAGWPVTQAREKIFERGPMSLYFDRSEFNNEQIAEVISLLSELYGTVGGDRLVIRGTTLFVPERQPVPEGV